MTEIRFVLVDDVYVFLECIENFTVDAARVIPWKIKIEDLKKIIKATEEVLEAGK